VRVKLGEIDEITLDVHGTVVERLDTPAQTASDAPDEAAEEDEDDAAGPIAIAVDMGDAEAPVATGAPQP
jgi:exoribonuclease-2